MSYLQQRVESYAVDDQSWLGSRHGVGEAESITLDTSTFTAATHYPDGFFVSGLPLQRNATSGKYEPWATGANLAGFLFGGVPAPDDTGIDVVAAMLDHCKVVTSRLPVSVDAAGQTSAAGRIIFL